MKGTIDPGSFRDPAGSVFRYKDEVYRQITEVGKADYDALMSTGLYDALIAKQLLIAHKEVKNDFDLSAYKIIKPKTIPFISYPYEWSFSQLKDAALVTLEIQKVALAYGMELKDASGYNIQFLDGKPIFIDTLSFRKRATDAPWEGYGQFCRHFLAPLALMAKVDIELNKLLITAIDGIPLDTANKLLPRTTKLKPGIFMHLSLHARSQAKHAATTAATPKQTKVSTTALLGIISSLGSTVRSLRPKSPHTEWADYYNFTNYNSSSFGEKKKLVKTLIKKTKATQVLDIGANNGLFSRVAAEVSELVISADIDPFAVEHNYLTLKQNNEKSILPLKLDLINPSPAIGWANNERQNITKRCQSIDLVMALALVHHLALSNNVPLPKIFEYFTQLAPYLLIEFVPKEDSQVKKLLATRKDIFPDYTIEGFEAAAKKYYKVTQKVPIKNSHRVLYLLERKG